MKRTYKNKGKVLKDITGLRAGKLVVVERDRTTQKNFWIVKCDCGKVKSYFRGHLTAGRVDNCGCSTTEKRSQSRKTHGETNTRLFKIWNGMVNRCTNKNNQSYKNYGGRGIQICQEWLDKYENFRDWALAHEYSEKLSIDRIDNNGSYSPENCRWVTQKEQANNTRCNHIISFNGESHTVAEWSKIINFPRWTIINRIKYGWSIEKILTTHVEEVKTYKKRISV